MGDIAELNRLDDDLHDLDRYLDAIEAEEAAERVKEHDRLHQQKWIDLLTTPRVSQEFLWILGQDEYWVNKEKQHVPLNTINPRYASNICNFLLVRAVAIKNAMEAWFLTTKGPSGEQASYDFDRAFDEVLNSTPEELVKRSELYRALDKIAMSEGFGA